MDDRGDRVYLHRGIAGRQFQRSFVMAEGIEVTTARLQDGLLHVDLSRLIPEPQVKKIKIETGDTNEAKKSRTIEVEPNNG